MTSYMELCLAALAPGATAVILFYLERKGVTGKIPNNVKTVIYGIIFGILAICGTEFGIPMNNAQINCRDAAVLIAGLVFGGPAGIIAGTIGGLERWIAVAWGVASYTRVACSVSTFLAGIFAALISRYMLEKKKPSCGMALFIGIAIEVFHLMMVFFTHIDDAGKAIEVIRSCSILLISANALSLFLAVFLLAMITGEGNPFRFKRKSETPVFETIQKGMLLVIGICLVATCFFVYRLENNLSVKDAGSLLHNTLSDTSEELEQKVDHYIAEQCRQIWTDINKDKADTDKLVEKYGICEYFYVDEDGIVTESNLPECIGYDMNSSEQSAEFMCLLNGSSNYVQEYGPIAAKPEISRKAAGIRTGDGFFEITYDAEKLYRIASDNITDLVTYRHVGRNGYVVVTDENNEIISCTEDSLPSEITIWLTKTDSETTSITETEIEGTGYYYRTRDCEGYTIWALYPMSAANMQRDIMVYITIFLIILVFMAIYVLLYMIIKKIVVDQIEKMTRSLSVISSGNLDEVVDVRSNEEFASLSNDINRTVDTLKTYIAEAAARIDKELELASTIQLSALPRSDGAFPKRKDFDIYARTDPAKEVGGDFYDFYFTGRSEFNIMIADVSDKGIPAAMFMMRAKSTLKDMTEKGNSIDEVFTEGNNSLCNGNEAEMFVTAWQSKIHLDTGLVEYVNAGHEEPLFKHGDEPFVYLKQKRNLVLGALEDIPYTTQEFRMAPGDVILLYTDGVVEAADAKQDFYGTERLLNIVNSCQYETMKELMAEVRKDVDAFVGNAPQFDDLTMLAFRYNGPFDLEQL